MTAPSRVTASEFEALIRAGIPLSSALPFSVVSMEKGRAVIDLGFSPDQLRPGGSLSGPTMFTLVDTALYAAVLSEIGLEPLAVTTDVPVARPEDAGIEAAEIGYLCAAANLYFRRQIAPDDVTATWSGIRALYDDGAGEARAVTRDYVLDLDSDGPPLLSVFGGKITTYRKLAEHALDLLEVAGPWTAGAVLPGGDVGQDFESFLHTLTARRPDLPPALLRRLARAYGTRARTILGEAKRAEDLGRPFGAGLTEAEIAYLKREEWAETGADVLWRRSKLGLHMTEAERAEVDAYMLNGHGVQAASGGAR